MQVYSITSVVNNDSSEYATNYGAASAWVEVFHTKEEALNLLLQWGCEPMKNKEDEVYVAKKVTDRGEFYFYYRINNHYLKG